MTRIGNLDRAVSLARTVVEDYSASGRTLWTALAITTLVEALLKRGSDGDLEAACTAMDELAAVPTDPGFVLHDITLLRLRTLLARAMGEDGDYRQLRDNYRKMAEELGFEGHMAWAEAMD
jgi:adenylate cyclase